MDTQTFAEITGPAFSAEMGAEPGDHPMATNRSTRAHAFALQMWTRSAIEGIHLGTGPHELAQNLPVSGVPRLYRVGFGISLADIWSVTDSVEPIVSHSTEPTVSHLA